MGVDFVFTALTEVDDAVREEILDELPNETIAEGAAISIRTTPSTSSRASRRRTATRSSRSCRRSNRISIEKSLDYPEDSAGRRMQTEFIALPPF